MPAEAVALDKPLLTRKLVGKSPASKSAERSCSRSIRTRMTSPQAGRNARTPRARWGPRLGRLPAGRRTAGLATAQKMTCPTCHGPSHRCRRHRAPSVSGSPGDSPRLAAARRLARAKVGLRRVPLGNFAGDAGEPRSASFAFTVSMSLRLISMLQPSACSQGAIQNGAGVR